MRNINRHDRITQTNHHGELILPIAHYALIHSKKKNPTKISIYGLGSCIAIIIIDQKNQLHAVSHVLLPKSEIQDSDLRYPHKFVNSSVTDLIKNLIRCGSNKKNLKAIIVGGASIFKDQNNKIGQQNTEMSKIMLNKLDIEICFEDVGGNKGRTIIYYPNKEFLLIKTNKGKKKYKIK